MMKKLTLALVAVLVLALAAGGGYYFATQRAEKEVRSQIVNIQDKLPNHWTKSHGAVSASLFGGYSVKDIVIKGDSRDGDFEIGIARLLIEDIDLKNEVPQHLKLRLEGVQVFLDNPDFPEFLRRELLYFDYSYRYQPESESFSLDSSLRLGDIFSLALDLKLQKLSKELFALADFHSHLAKMKDGDTLNTAEQQAIQQTLYGSIFQWMAVEIEEAKLGFYNSTFLEEAFAAQAQAGGLPPETVRNEILQQVSGLAGTAGGKRAEAIASLRQWIAGDKANFSLAIKPNRPVSVTDISLLTSFAAMPGGEEQLFEKLGLIVVAD